MGESNRIFWGAACMHANGGAACMQMEEQHACRWRNSMHAYGGAACMQMEQHACRWSSMHACRWRSSMHADGAACRWRSSMHACMQMEELECTSYLTSILLSAQHLCECTAGFWPWWFHQLRRSWSVPLSIEQLLHWYATGRPAWCMHATGREVSAFREANTLHDCMKSACLHAYRWN